MSNRAEINNLDLVMVADDKVIDLCAAQPPGTKIRVFGRHLHSIALKLAERRPDMWVESQMAAQLNDGERPRIDCVWYNPGADKDNSSALFLEPNMIAQRGEQHTFPYRTLGKTQSQVRTGVYSVFITRLEPVEEEEEEEE